MKKIGVFDSGIGGLKVLYKLLQFRGLHLIYVADFFHMPYGNKSILEIQKYCDAIVSFLVDQGVETIIIACNTATVVAQDWLEKKYPHIRFVSGIDVAVQKATLLSANHAISVWATPVTVATQVYQQKLVQENTHIEACDHLAEYIECNDVDAITLFVQQAVQRIHQHGSDVLILGCTHYGFISDIIHRYISENIHVVTSDNHVDLLLKELALCAAQSTEQKISLFISTQEATYVSVPVLKAMNMKIYAKEA